MKYGYFDDENREYVITSPELPHPWINYLGSDNYFGLISHTGGGYSFYKDARLRRITRYRYNNIPTDSNGRYFFIKDGDDYYSPTWMPVRKDLEFFECRHGMGYTKIKGKRNGLQTEVLYMVPLRDNIEIHKVEIKNEGIYEKKIKLFSYIEFCLWNAYDDMTNYQRTYNIGAVEVEGNTIYHKTDYRERRNHFAFYNVNEDICGFDTDRDAFLGLYNGLEEPQVVREGKSNNSIAEGWNPIASHYLEISLKPGEKKEIIYILGYVENHKDHKWESKGILNKEKAKILIAKYTKEYVEECLQKLKSYWNHLLSKYVVKTSDEKLNRMVNIWNPYQCMVTFNISRSASYFESGIGRGMGFRDSNQDLLGFVHQVPDKARRRILDIAATQFEDGSTYHQYQPLSKKGNDAIGSGFNDDPLWLILSTTTYIKETGDLDILEESVSFNNDEKNQGSLWQHLKKSFEYTITHLGPHKLPLIGRADWNDCLNLNSFSENPDESFQTCENKKGETAESIFIAGLFIYTGKELEQLSFHVDKENYGKFVHSKVEDMIRTVEKHGYDGQWFLRAYDYYGQKVGSHINKEGKIYIEPQGMCIMAGIGKDNGLAQKTLDSVDRFLNTEYGLILQTPPYSEYHPELGEISSYPPGYKENSGIFCHNNPWIMIAETILGRGNKAFEYYKKITPAYLEDISDIHKLEPYVYAQMIAGRDAAIHGEAKNSWLTGTAAWNYEAITKWILGIRPDYCGLIIDPCIPNEWDDIQIQRVFRSAIYNIHIQNPKQISKGVEKIIVDGIPQVSNLVAVFCDRQEHRIEVIMG